MTIRELLKYYVGHTLELCSGDECELMTRELALRLYEDSEIDYMYTTDLDGGSYLTVILKEEAQ